MQHIWDTFSFDNTQSFCGLNLFVIVWNILFIIQSTNKHKNIQTDKHETPQHILSQTPSKNNTKKLIKDRKCIFLHFLKISRNNERSIASADWLVSLLPHVLIILALYFLSFGSLHARCLSLSLLSCAYAFHTFYIYAEERILTDSREHKGTDSWRDLAL